MNYIYIYEKEGSSLLLQITKKHSPPRVKPKPEISWIKLSAFTIRLIRSTHSRFTIWAEI